MSSDGTTGADFGVSFSENAQAICLNTPDVVCSNTSKGGLGNPDSQLGAPFFLSGEETFMNVEGGYPFFRIGVAFDGMAQSVSFAGVGNQIVFDDVTFGSVTPGWPIQEPTTVSLIAGGVF